MKIPELKLPFNISLTRTSDFIQAKTLAKLGELEAKSAAERTAISDWKAYSDKDRDYTFDVPKRTLYDVWRASSVLTTIQNSIKFAVFRNGGHWVEEFVAKCNDCGRKYQFKKSTCDCGGKTRGPDYKQLQFAGDWFDGGYVNSNNKTLLDVLRIIDPDYQVVDTGFMLVRKEYEFSRDGTIAAGHVVEILPVDPLSIEFVQDRSNRFGFDNDGTPMNVCPMHRDYAGTNERCSTCGLATYPAHFYAKVLTKTGEKLQFFLEDEIIHENKYTDGLKWGTPQIYACFNLVNAFISMDKYIDSTYSGERYPRSLLFMRTNMAPDAIQTQWTDYLMRLKENPRYFAPFPVNNAPEGGPMTEFVKLFDTLAEMQYVESRQTGRAEIGAIFGVQPIFMGDTSTSGGLNNDGMQITVTNRGTEMGQSPHNRMLKKLCLMFGITDFVYKLMPNEEADEAADEDLEAKRLANAKLASEMGLEVERGEDGTFSFSGKVSAKQPQPGLPGLPGQMPQETAGQGSGILAEAGSNSFGGAPATAGITKESKRPKRLDEDEMDDVLASIAEDIKYKRAVPEDVMLKRVEKLAKKMGTRLEDKTKAEIRRIYVEEAAKIGKEAGAQYVFGAPDTNALNTIAAHPVFTKAFKGMSSGMQDKIKKIISESYSKERFNFDDMVAEMGEAVEAQKSDLERIARTEGQNISNIARTNAYRKVLPPDVKFKWSIQQDNRTTEHCRKIHEAAEKGVSLSELQRIVKENADPNTYDPSRPWTPHLNCRSIVIRKV